MYTTQHTYTLHMYIAILIMKIQSTLLTLFVALLFEPSFWLCPHDSALSAAHPVQKREQQDDDRITRTATNPG